MHERCEDCPYTARIRALIEKHEQAKTERLAAVFPLLDDANRFDKIADGLIGLDDVKEITKGHREDVTKTAEVIEQLANNHDTIIDIYGKLLDQVLTTCYSGPVCTRKHVLFGEKVIRCGSKLGQELPSESVSQNDATT